MLKAEANDVDHIRDAVNFGERRGVGTPDILLLHYTGMESAQGALDWLCCEESGVSCHYFVEEDGTVWQLVSEAKRAHHAGQGSWERHEDVNSRSIGIEIVNAGHPGGLPDFPDAQMKAVAALSRDILDRHSISPRHVLAHSDIAPGRKEDPGEKFDWQFLHGQGVGHWVEPVPVGPDAGLRVGDEGDDVERFQRNLASYGYGLDVTGTYCERTAIVAAAFQRHFRQERVDGVADASTTGTLERLLSA